MASPADSALRRAFAPLVGVFWTLFAVWSFLVALVWTTGWGEVQLAEHVHNPGLRGALIWMFRALDPIWITLGAINVYIPLARTEGLSAARRWSVVVLLCGIVVPLASVLTRWPLGPIYYPLNFGIKLGPVPFALPLLWLVLVVGARDAAQRLLPRVSHFVTVFLAGLFVLATDLNLEPLAWKWRAWWLWYPADRTAPGHPPWQNYATWLVAGIALATMMRSTHVARRPAPLPFEPCAVLIMVNAVCLLTHLVLFLRR